MKLTSTPTLVKGVVRPPHGERDELHVILPCGHACALIPEIHSWDSIVQNVSPSIVCHSNDYHGYYQNGQFS
jgi:hypothetical protein